MKEIAIGVFSIQSFFGIAFSSFLTIVFANWLYKVSPSIKPLYSMMVMSFIFSFVIFLLSQLPFSVDNIFTAVVYALLIYACGSGFASSLSSTIRNTGEAERGYVFGQNIKPIDKSKL